MIYPGYYSTVLEKSLLLSGRMICICLLGPFVYSSVSLSIFCLDVQSIIESSYYYYMTVYFFLQICQCLFYVLKCSDAEYIYIYNFYIFLMKWLCYYIASFFGSWDSMWLNIYFKWYNYSYLCSLLVTICMAYLLLSLHYQPVCAIKSKISFL